MKEKKIAEFCYRTSCRSFLLLTESRFIFRNVIPLCSLFHAASTWKIIIPTLLTLFLFPLFIVFKLSFKTTFISVFVLCCPLPHTEETLFLHIFATLIIVQMIDFLVNCTSAPYIIKICDFVALWSEDNIRRELSFFVQNIYR